MHFKTLAEWLEWQESLHHSTIELGLERPGQVFDALNLPPLARVVISVAGTNGKGSSVAMFEAILRAGGYRVGCYTSPHLLRYNERIRIDGQAVDDQTICEAFEHIEQARGDTSLTYFEFGTLAAFDIFSRSNLDVAILEVGMGGRLDAVNLIDADVALITAIDLDHAGWLGSDRETIGREKAGIMRAGRVAVSSDSDCPDSIIKYADEIGASLLLIGRDFEYSDNGAGWDWWDALRHFDKLPIPALAGRFQRQNAAGVLQVLTRLEEALPLSESAINEGLCQVHLSGRFQVLDSRPTRIFDVAHNPHAAEQLAVNLAALPCKGRTLAVWAMLADKDIDAMLIGLKQQIDKWFIAGLDMPRGASAQQLNEALGRAGINGVDVADSVVSAYQAALAEAQPSDRVVVFGSFFTVAAVLPEPV